MNRSYLRATSHFLFFSLLLLATTQRSHCQSPDDSLFKNAHIAGAQWAFTDHGVTRYFHYGLRQEGSGALITDTTIFQAASLGKVVLAYITLRFIDRGLLNADTPLSRYFKYEKIGNDSPAKSITAAMVLHHTSGLPNWGANPLSKAWYKAQLSLSFAPGTAWQYSGEGFMYLQFALEAIATKPLVQIANEEVFTPLQMQHSSFVWLPRFDTDAAWGHNKEGTATERGEFFLPAAAFSLLTTAHDYAHFVNCFSIDKSADRDILRKILSDTTSVTPPTHQVSEAGKHIAWGPGLGIQYNQNGPALWHWGDNGDYKAFFLAFPGKQQSLVYFANSQNGLAILPQLLDKCFGKQQWWSLDWLNE